MPQTGRVVCYRNQMAPAGNFPAAPVQYKRPVDRRHRRNRKLRLSAAACSFESSSFSAVGSYSRRRSSVYVTEEKEKRQNREETPTIAPAVIWVGYRSRAGLAVHDFGGKL